MANPEKGLLGKAFKKDAKGVMTYLAALDNDGVAALQKEMERFVVVFWLCVDFYYVVVIVVVVVVVVCFIVLY